MQISRNHVVTLKYQVADRDGEVVDAGLEPLVYLHGGYGGVFDALEVALQGKSEGEVFSVALWGGGIYGTDQKTQKSLKLRCRCGMRGNCVFFRFARVFANTA